MRLLRSWLRRCGRAVRQGARLQGTYGCQGDLTAQPANMASKESMSEREIPWKRDETFELYARKFRSIFDMHGVSFGSREDLGEFVPQLRENRHLAMDFWALVGALSGREGGPLPDEAMLALVVESIAGSEVTTADGEWGSVVTTLASLLAGVDLEPPAAETTTVYEPEKRSAAEGVSLGGRDGAEAGREVGRGVGLGLADTEVAVGAGSATVVTAKAYRLDEALLRIEQNSLELKLHLDKIDDRMKRIEPQLEELSLRASSAAEVPRRGAESGRLVLEPAGLRAEEPRLFAVPLEGYAAGGGYRRVLVLVGLLLLLVAGGIVVQQKYGGSARERLLGLAEWSGVGGRDGAGGSVAGAGPDADIVDAGKAEGQPPTVAARPAGLPAGVRDAGAGRRGANAESPPPRRRAMEGAAEPTAASAEDSFGDIEEGLVRVAPSIMADYLVASRVPAYPEAAKRDEVQGPVVLQVTVSADGFVTAARVVTGERVLRSAAVEAVRAWRYRPYFVNGQPTAVSTSITIDFRLNR